MGDDQENMEEFEPGAPSENFLDGVSDDLNESVLSEEEERIEALENGALDESRSEAENVPQENPYADEEEKTDPIVENEILQAEREMLPEEQLKKLPEFPGGHGHAAQHGDFKITQFLPADGARHAQRRRHDAKHKNDGG